MDSKLTRALAGISLATLLLPAVAQDRSACSLVGCSAAGVRPEVLQQAIKESPVTPQLRSDAGNRLRSLKPQGDAWQRNIPGQAGEEDYSCALSFGIGGQLSKQGFLGTRVLGKTQAWRDPEGEQKH